MIRKLHPEEHGRTRALYEAAFPEDEQAFVDYYYQWKIRDSVIYCAEDGNGIHAMVHLNPFQVSIYGQIRRLHYIVAVATEEKYRHQGLMRRLLEAAMQEMQQNGEPFTFLMPAKEAIYLPFGFRYTAWQRKGIWPVRTVDAKGKNESQKAAPKEKAVRPVMPGEYQRLADFANRVLADRADVFIWRDAGYYERLVEEQRCQGGAVMVITAEEEIIGSFCTVFLDDKKETSGCKWELREMIIGQSMQEDGAESLQRYVDQVGACLVAGCPESLPLIQEQQVPLLMMRRLAGDVPDGNIFINEIV